MDPILGLAVGSLVVAFLSFWLHYRNWRDDRRKRLRQDVEEDYKAPAERDSIIVAGAAEAVASLQAALAQSSFALDAVRRELETVRAERDQYKGISDDQGARISFLENQIFQMIYNNKK